MASLPLTPVYTRSGSYHSVSHSLGNCLHKRLIAAQKKFETHTLGKPMTQISCHIPQDCVIGYLEAIIFIFHCCLGGYFIAARGILHCCLGRYFLYFIAARGIFHCCLGDISLLPGAIFFIFHCCQRNISLLPGEYFIAA